ncbi:kinase-like domain-containing protein [Rhizophagus irregularis DAOM 181602=DAOM 197198]|nr:kinase-like domain-containing protein [Rhizophagus irregularis DAOM 181602=DAOM 197198]
MTDIREDVVWAAYNRAYSLVDFNIHNTLDKRHEFKKQTVLADESLTKDEKSELENVESANQRWFEESKSHLTIINGMRPKIVSGTPSEYKKLMEQCWDADLTKRPDVYTLEFEMKKLLLYFNNNQNESYEQIISNQHQQLSNYYSSNSIDSMSKNYTSKTYQFENFPEPKNATEEEQEAFHSKPYSFNIPNEVDDFNNSSVEKNVNVSKSNSVYKDINDDDDIYDNSNSHLEKQDDSNF